MLLTKLTNEAKSEKCQGKNRDHVILIEHYESLINVPLALSFLRSLPSIYSPLQYSQRQKLHRCDGEYGSLRWERGLAFYLRVL
jgi:hypothetical protein